MVSNVFSSGYFIKVLSKYRMKWVGNIARMLEVGSER